MADRWNILQRQIILLGFLAGDVLSEVVWSAARSSPVCRWLVELVDPSGRVVITSSHYVTMPALSDGAENAWLVGPQGELLIGDKTGPMYPIDGFEGAIFEVIEGRVS